MKNNMKLPTPIIMDYPKEIYLVTESKPGKQDQHYFFYSLEDANAMVNYNRLYSGIISVRKVMISG